MYLIIPQFYKIELKKLLKEKINKITNSVADNLIENLFDTDINKYTNLMLDLQQDMVHAILDIISECLTIIDNIYRESAERKSQFHINIRHDERSITTIFGPLTIVRTYYETKDRQEHFYFIDTLLGLPKYDHYDNIVKGIAINNSIKTNQKLGSEITNSSLASIKDSYLDNSITISRQNIYNWIKEWQVPMVDYKPIATDGKLYVMIDEKYIHEQIKIIDESDINEEEKKAKKKQYIMSKCMVAFTGIKQEGKRRILENRFVFITTSTTPWKNFMDQISKIYDFEELETIITLSDAGNWITAGFSELKLFPTNKIISCLCEFHVRQKVNRITKDNALREKLNNAIDNDDKKEFKELMSKIKENKKDNEKRLKKLGEYENYILKHWNKIKNMENSECKSSMESHISHCVASYFSSRPKAYGKINIEKLIKLQEYKINGIDILSLYLDSWNNDEIEVYSEEEPNFSLFEKVGSNVPIIDNGQNTIMFKILNNIAKQI